MSGLMGSNTELFLEKSSCASSLAATPVSGAPLAAEQAAELILWLLVWNQLTAPCSSLLGVLAWLCLTSEVNKIIGNVPLLIFWGSSEFSRTAAKVPATDATTSQERNLPENVVPVTAALCNCSFHVHMKCLVCLIIGMAWKTINSYKFTNLDSELLRSKLLCFSWKYTNITEKGEKGSKTGWLIGNGICRKKNLLAYPCYCIKEI